jgi:hypothetical protein
MKELLNIHHLKMKRKSINMENVVRKLAVCCLLLFAFAGSVAAQNDPLHVIKKGDHYLAHVGTYDAENDTTIWSLQDAATFDPSTCLWHSGNTANVLGLHHNYYFIDSYGKYRFLAAPLQANGQLSLSANLPSIQLLRNTDQIYYFYDWDPDQYGAGVARGHKYTGVDYSGCNHSWHWFNENNHSLGGECWEVYWVEYDNGTWELSAASSYNIPPNGSRYRSVSITEYDEEITGITSGLLPDLQDFTMEFGTSYSPSITIPGEVTAGSYTPAYTTYVFEGVTHNYYGGVDHGTVAPSATEYSGSYVSLEWTITGDGAFYISFDETEHYTSTDSETPTIYYNRPNTTGHHTATLTLTVTYVDSQGQLSTQERTATISLRSECLNPGQAANPVVSYEGVTVSWYPTASQYRVYLTTDPNTWTEFYEVDDVTSYTFTGLAYETQYYYKVVAYCNGAYLDINDATTFDFISKGEAGLLVYGAVFGGGRMGDVGGNTAVAIINCDSIHAVYGGNDIARTVSGNDGATITVGVESDDPNDFDDYGTTNAPIRIGDVYGGGNGYYAYNGTSFEPASYNTVYTIAPNDSIVEMTINQQLGETVWTNTTDEDVTFVSPTIKKSKITVTNDYVKIDSVFGGAKNAILNATSNDVTININGGTIFTVFGGNNYGGSLGYQSQERITVTNTSTEIDANYHDGVLGRDFGIGYLFGGGNKVQGQNVFVTVEGGQIDTIFGGGNEADVRSTEVKVQCALGAYDDNTGAYGKVYTNAIGEYSEGDLTNNAINGRYGWDRSGIYNVRTLFGGNNRASMSGIPNLILTSGGIGTVYGGGNEGDMLAQEETTIMAPNTYGNDPVSMNVKYGTHVQMDSPNILIDFLYGGCQKSNVDYSTWTEIMNGHVGTVYGGCNISGDVGSTRVNPNVSSNPPSEAYQAVQGGTYVKATGGVVYNNLFGGSNGFYHCNNGISYIEGVNYCPPENYVGWAIPTHNETHAIITGTALIKGNVYAGGNMAPVGFTDATVGERTFPQFVGLASLRMDGGEVVGNVFGGGNMASILGGNDVIVSGGKIGMTDEYDGALYGGNDRSGQVGQISNRVFPAGYDIASDGYTSLSEVNTYVSLTGKPDINTVYGGGNGDYDYVNGDDVIPAGDYCSYDDQDQFNDKPIQTNTFVDINITGNNNDGTNGGHINTVYGGGNGVTVTGSITVFLNVKDPLAYDQVGTIFGGNNKDNVVETENVPLVPDIILLHGQVGTVYGGCNKGAMTTGKNFNIGGKTYYNVGSMVRLRSSYQATPNAPVVIPDAVVSNAVYGGCRMNNVDHNSLVLVEGVEGQPAVPAMLFGGCDISGMVGDTSLVVLTGGQVNGNIYAGGNGFYYYKLVDNTGVSGTHYEVYTDESETEKLADSVASAPISRVSRVDLLGGQVGIDATHIAEVFGGGFGQPTNTTGNVIVNVGPATATSWTGLPVVYGNVYGGSAFGSVNYVEGGTTSTTNVNFLNGSLHGMLFGGGLGRKEEGSLAAIEAKVYGKVFVTISNATQDEDECFIDLRDADIYGCNNQNGSPQDDVRVDVWKTAFNFSDYLEGDIYTASYSGNDASYAIDEVFGGGNQANYAPAGGENSTKRTKVFVHNCLNTIRRVFSGGNAAAAVGVVNTIQGGRMDYVFGGGNGEVSAANIGSGGTNLVVMGGTINSLFGGSNSSGDIAGQMYTEVNNESGCAEYIAEFYGGCNLAPLTTNSGVYSIIKCGSGTIAEAYGGSKLADIEGDVTLDVRGGTIAKVFGGSKGREGTTDADAADIDGNVTLNLEGGNITNAFGGSNINGNITGNITVNVIDFGGICGLDLTNVYGCGNLTPYNPSGNAKPVVNVMHIAREEGIRGNVFGGAYGASATVTSNPIVNIGYVDAMSGYLPDDLPEDLSTEDFVALVSGNVYGGGELAPVAGSTEINVNNGTVVHKVVGGGKQANITANTEVYIKGGNIGTDSDAVTGLGKGVYGGCDQAGNVGGYTLVELTGGTVGVSDDNTANVHGGGYGSATTVTGNVTVNFGDDRDLENTGLVLYGDLYGGSALGHVNTADENTPGETTTTTVNLRNGTINGGVYGGGLGQKAGVNGATENIEAYVYGNVYVNVGGRGSGINQYTGKANLVNCDVYGCNNLNGSPKSEVHVDVFQTLHTADNVWTNTEGGYAIHQVFGGGNRADYEVIGKNIVVHVYSCENTINRLFGGGNAAEVYGVQLTIDGGRFNQVFGGGNGEFGAADIGAGGINIRLGGGIINALFNGSNLHGDIAGEISMENFEGECGSAVVSDHYMGSNQADIFGPISEIIYCENDPEKIMKFVNLYCGSNKAQIYGNINLTIEGGIFENVFGGSKGSKDDPETTEDETYVSNIQDDPATPDEIEGHVNLTILGGTIGTLYGACDVNGNVTGRVNITIHSCDNDCGLFIGDIYGGGNQTSYEPVNLNNGINSNYTYSPEIKILKATVGGNTPDLPIIPSEDDPSPKHYDGNVFGGGNYGHVSSSPRVIVGDGNNSPVTILGDVFGGGNRGDITGSPQVIVVPLTHTFSASKVTAEGDNISEIYVTNSIGHDVNGEQIGENLDVKLKAITNIYGYKFDHWQVVSGEGVVANPNATSTVFTMGTTDAEVQAIFTTAPNSHTFSYSYEPVGGGIVVAYDGFGNTVNNNSNISEGAVLNIEAIASVYGYIFNRWEVTEGNGTLGDSRLASTTFTIGDAAGVHSIKAVFEQASTRVLTYAQSQGGTFTVKDRMGQSVDSGSAITTGALLNLEATPDNGYRFVRWNVEGLGASVSSPSSPTTTFTMGTGQEGTTLSAVFERIQQP